jgi:glycosyltransferase involved in cell wall biosynthesis
MWHKREHITITPLPETIRAREADTAFTYRGDADLLPSERVRELVRGYMSRPQDRKVSIVTPVYNRAAAVATAVKSVIGQSYTNWELLIIDDGSVDETARVLNTFLSDTRIAYTLIGHAGVCAARNTALAAASGELVTYLDSDNEWHPDYLLMAVNWMKDRVSRCGYTAQADYHLDKGTGYIRLNRYDRGLLLDDNYIDLNVFMHEASLLGESGTFDLSLSRWVDWDFIIRVTRTHEPSVLPVVLGVYYRQKSLRSISDVRSKIYKNRVIDKHDAEWRRLLETSGKPLPVQWWARFDRRLRYHKRAIEHRLLRFLARGSGERQ